MAADGCVELVVVLTKTDLITRDELNQKLAIFSSIGGVGVIALSAITGDGFDEFQNMLEPKKTCCLLGSSGVGKTTLINRLIGREVFETPACGNWALSATAAGSRRVSGKSPRCRYIADTRIAAMKPSPAKPSWPLFIAGN